MRLRQIHAHQRNLLIAMISKTVCAVVVLWFLLVGCTRGTSANTGLVYFVNGAQGLDSGPGTQAQPWRTIEKSNQTLRAGDTVIIGGGVYDEVIDPNRSGELGRPITYKATVGERVLLRGKPNVPELIVIRRSYIVIDGLELSYGHDLPKKERRWAWITLNGTEAHHNEIRNCRLIRDGDPVAMYRDKYQERGIVLSGAQHNLIENNYIRGLNIGIHITQSAQYNLIRFNHISETSQSAIAIGSSQGVLMGNLIERNILESSAIEDGIQFLQNSAAPHPDEDISNFGTIVRNNVIRYNAENAIDLKGAAHVVIEGNVIYGNIGSNNGPLNNWNRRSMYAIGRGANANASDVIIRYNVIYDNPCGVWLYDRFKVYNNTIVYNNRDYSGNSGVYRSNSSPDFCGVFERKYGSSQIAVKNNIIGGHQEGQAILRVGRKSDADVDHNLYFDARNAENVDFDTAGKWQEYSLQEWQQLLASLGHIVGRDEHSMNVEPAFRYVPNNLTGDHSDYDFFLNRDSAAIDSGGPLTYARGSGSGNRIAVADAGYFYNGFGVTAGDKIQVGGSTWVQIVDVDYKNHEVVVDQSITWQDGDSVNLPYSGSAPDIGAHEYYELNYHTYLPLIER